MQELSRVAPVFVSTHPNAGLPNEFGGYDETPEYDGRRCWVSLPSTDSLNIVGGCCGTTPAHIAAIAEAVRGRAAPRGARHAPPTPAERARAAHGRSRTRCFVNVGERTNVTGSRRFAKLILDGKYEAALEVARQQVENGAQILDVNMDEGLLDSRAAMVTFLNLIAAEPDISRVPVMIDSSKWSVIEAGLQCVQGKGIVNSISLKEGEAEFLRQADAGASLRRGRDRHGLRRAGPGRHAPSARWTSATRAYRLLTEQVGFPPEDIIFDPNIFAIAHRDRGARQLRRRVHRGHPAHQGDAARTRR